MKNPRKIMKAFFRNDERAETVVAAPLAISAPVRVALLLVCALVLTPLGVRAVTNELSAALQTGLFEEEANRNLPAAIEAYEKVAKQFDQNRALAATAIFRLGEVNRKQGKTNEAAAYYQRILREFTDQDTLVKLSQQNLAGMGVLQAPLAAARQNQQYDAAIIQLEAQVEKDSRTLEVLKSLKGTERLRALVTIPEGDSISDMMRQVSLAEQRLYELQKTRGAAHPDVVAQTAQVQDISKKLEDRADVLVLGLGKKVASENDFLEKLKARVKSGASLAAVDSSNDAQANTVALRAAETEAARLEIEVQRLKALNPAEFRLVAQQNYANPVLIKLFQDLATAEQQVVVVGKDYGPDNANMINAKLVVATIQKQIDEQMNGVLVALQAKRDVALATAKGLRTQMAQNTSVSAGKTGESVPIATVVDEEETEIRRIQSMIQNSPDLINAPGQDGLTPLYRAVTAGQLRVARFLLDNGADINTRTVLPGAAGRGHKAMVEFLLSRGAVVNAMDSEYYTALHRAAMNGFRSVAEVLLANKADVNARGPNMVTPLHLAVSAGHGELASYFISKGADVDAQDSSGQTPLIKAAIKGHTDLAGRLLAAKAKTDVEDNQGCVALSHAVDKGNAEIVKALLAAKANPDAGKVNLPVHCAIRTGDTNVLEALLRAGADANRVAKVRWNFSWRNNYYNEGAETAPLPLALVYNRPAVIKILLACKADPNGKDLSGTPLIFDVLNDAELTKAFLDAGANVNVGDAYENPRTPLIATTNANVSSLLLAAGADAEVRLYGMTALTYAADGGNKSKVEALLKGGANVNAATATGWTALHLAAKKQYSEIVSLLLANKADVNARNDAGLTPLDIASGKGQQSGMIGGTLVLGNPPPPSPLAYQWQTGQGAAKSSTASVAEVLRQYGGLSELPKFDRIELRRPGSFQNAIFYKGSNDWNHFTLMDVIFNNYYKGNGYGVDLVPRAPTPEDSFNDKLRRLVESVGSNSATEPSFPDLRRIVVVRQQPGKKTAERITVDLLNATNGVDCGKDMALNFGDVVEIPERIHTLQEMAVGLTLDETRQIFGCRDGMVTLVYQGKKTELPVAGHPAAALVGSVLAREDVRKALFSSADLKRVKVTRKDVATGKPNEWIMNCSDQQKMPDLWLRDGDVVEVPEK